MNCPSCSAKLRIPDVLGGRRCRCPKCGLEFRAPSLEGHPAVPRPPSPRVFISHDSTDRQFVEKEIKPLLESHGINRWWTEENIPTGADWEAALQAGLEESDWFLVILSPRSVESPWVKREVQRALATKPGRVIPVLMEKCDRHRLHPRLALLQFADFSASAEVAG